MRLSCREDDPGFQPADKTLTAVIYLNGSEITGVITADEERGFILRYMRDEQGRIRVDGNEARTEKLYGKVQIEIPGVYEKPALGATDGRS